MDRNANYAEDVANILRQSGKFTRVLVRRSPIAGSTVSNFLLECQRAKGAPYTHTLEAENLHHLHPIDRANQVLEAAAKAPASRSRKRKA